MDKLFEKIISFPKTREGTHLFVGFLSGLFISWFFIFNDLSNASFYFIEINWLRYVISIAVPLVVSSYIFVLFATASSKPSLKESEKKLKKKSKQKEVNDLTDF